MWIVSAHIQHKPLFSHDSAVVKMHCSHDYCNAFLTKHSIPHTGTSTTVLDCKRQVVLGGVGPADGDVGSGEPNLRMNNNTQ